jgi:hypothetical protein
VLAYLIFYYAKRYTVPADTDTERALQTNGTPTAKSAILIVGNIVPPNVAGCNVNTPAADAPGNIPQPLLNDPDCPEVNFNVVVVL